MSGVSTGTPYHIRSSAYSGGYLGLPRGESGQTLRLGTDITRDYDSHKWLFRVSSPDGTPLSGGFSIENLQFSNLYASRTAGSDNIFAVRENIWEYYIVPTNTTSFYRICQDPGCSSLWVPNFSSAGAPRDNDYIVTRPSAPSPGVGYEVWEVMPVGDGVSSSSTTSATSDSSSTYSYRTTSTRKDAPAQTSQATGSGDLQALKMCAPCGKAQCSFSPSGPSKKATYSILIGQPVSNCHNKSQENTTTKLGGTFELQETFTVEATVSVGLGFLGPSISTTVGHSTSKKISQTQEIEVSIRPGQIHFVANVSYTTRPGQMSVDDSTLAFVSIQPEYVLGYSVVYTDCDSDFQALTMPKVECGNESGALSLRGPTSIKLVLLWTLLLTNGIFLV
ncbi:hypothetical protein FA13DRAFT_1731767 [Coprinellus micaceus]|uniref:Uncharacterized protein n=1 Tax=Coprinellus micaceus TaxID=71717 RepID=A0A4Y7TGD0_COPMI|nr:hypothetical protein FA13DRAFT_1731767 [Coprinellus micaceus]